MHDISRNTSGFNAVMNYDELFQEAQGLLSGERDWLANAANLSALLYQRLSRLNWAGFYFVKGAELVLGPFQGKPACVRIAFGRGVCGTAVTERCSQVVSDVHAFPGHIACDAASRSEIVIPLLLEDRVIGVLDLDSPEIDRFDDRDRQGLERIADLYTGCSTYP